MAAFETSKLLIIPIINHQHQPLERISYPPPPIHCAADFLVI
jgi:hypothetical protein